MLGMHGIGTTIGIQGGAESITSFSPAFKLTNTFLTTVATVSCSGFPWVDSWERLVERKPV